MSLSLKVRPRGETSTHTFDEQGFRDFFKVQYTPQLEFADWKAEQWIRRACIQANRKEKIGNLAKWLGNLHRKALLKPQIPDVTVQWIDPQMGYGLFTNTPLKKWSYIGEYTGLVRRRNLFFPDVNDYCFMYPRAWMALRAYTIDSEKQGNHTRFINHKDVPNCESVSIFHEGVFHIIFRTLEDIPAGTELTYDYGDVYWRRRKKR